MKKLLAFLALALPLAAQNITVQKTPHTATPADTLTDASKIIVVPSGGSVIASGSGVIRSTEGVATSVAWGNVTGTPTTLSGYGILNTLSTTAPLTGGGALSANLTVSMPASTNSVDGYLTAADHTTFAGKENVITFTAPLSRSVNTVSIPVATGSVNGYLSSADWTTFNAKQPAGNYITGLTGDITAAGPGSVAATLATVNSNVGTFGSATVSPVVTVNGKGLITAISNVTVTPAVGSITGLGTGVATALGVNVGTAGAFVVNGGALGTPSSGTLTNASGLPISSGVSGLGSGVATLLSGASSGTGGPAGTTSPTFVTPVLGVASATSVAHTGTAGAGFASFVSQSSTPAAPASGYVEFADSSGRRSWRRASDGFVRTWDATLTGNHVYTLQDADGTVAFVSTTVPSIAGTAGNVLVNGGTAAVAGSAVTLSLPATLTGVSAISSNLTVNSGLLFAVNAAGVSVTISPTTVDGTDNYLSILAGGGGSGSSRGAQFIAKGNEFSTGPGNAEILSGIGGSVILYTDQGGGNVAKMTISNAGDATFFRNLTLGGLLRVSPTAPASSIASLSLFRSGFSDITISQTTTNDLLIARDGNDMLRMVSYNLLLGNAVGDMSGVAGGIKTSATGASVAASSTTTGQVRFHDTSGDVGIGGGNIYASGLANIGGNLTVSGVASLPGLAFQNDGWISSLSDSKQRMLFTSSGTTYFKGGGASGVQVELRNASDAAIAQFSTAGSTIVGTLTVSGTGTSSIAGPLSVTGSSIIATAASNVKLGAVTTAATGAGAYFSLDSTSMTGGKAWEIRATGTTDSVGAGHLAFTVPGDAVYSDWSTTSVKFKQSEMLVGGGTTATQVGTARLVVTDNTLANSRGIGFTSQDGTYNPRAWIQQTATSTTHAITFDSDYSSGCGFATWTFKNGAVSVTSNAAASNTTSGALQVTGGISSQAGIYAASYMIVLPSSADGNLQVNSSSGNKSGWVSLYNGNDETRLIQNGNTGTYAGFPNRAGGVVLGQFNSSGGFIAVQDSGTPFISLGKTSSVQSSGTYTEWARLAATGITSLGSYTSAAPSGGTAAAWKMGQARTSTGLVVSTTTGVQLDVGGTLYTLAVLTTNP